jgi:hypothetical protein
MKKRLPIGLIFIIAAILTACHAATSAPTAEIIAPENTTTAQIDNGTDQPQTSTEEPEESITPIDETQSESHQSGQSGLYEYMIASAIDDITGYDYSVTEEYGWSDSKQLLAIYNERVTTTLTTFSEILENHSLNEEEKAEQIRELGIFAVAPLLDEMDTPSPEMSPESLETCLWNIIEDHTDKDVKLNLENWREQNERTYRDIIEILNDD